MLNFELWDTLTFISALILTECWRTPCKTPPKSSKHYSHILPFNRLTFRWFLAKSSLILLQRIHKQTNVLELKCCSLCKRAKQRLCPDTLAHHCRPPSPCFHEEANVFTSVISLSDCGRVRRRNNSAHCPKLGTPGTLADSRGSLFINPQHRSRIQCRAESWGGSQQSQHATWILAF